MNVVWHGHYARFFERARAALLREIDYGYQQMIEGGHLWPVIDMSFRFYRPLRLEQVIEIRAELVEWENRLKINYLIRDGSTGERLTRGSSVHVAVDRSTGEMLWETPAIFRRKLARFLS